jgi:hypothetical protein
MSNVDIEIYMNQFINFFENNPNDLIDLIGDTSKETFYEKVRMRCIENYEKGREISLTKDQMIGIVVEIKSKGKSKGKREIIKLSKIIESTKYGDIYLN